jgi:7-cyano-7-deazaguanine synthase
LITTDSVAVFSGGLDSTTLVYHMLAEGYIPHLLSFNYGQRHGKELQYAALTARQLQLPHDVVGLTGLTRLISNSALTSAVSDKIPGSDGTFHKIDVPEGHYAKETMKATVVPNRNMIMLSIAAGVAVNNKYRTIGIGVHSGDHFVYPDCRSEFIKSVSEPIWVGNAGFHNFSSKITFQPDEPSGGPIYAPFLYKTKADIAYRALELGVPLHLTWSCYKGGERHCGRCGTCVERLEAIDEAVRRHQNRVDGTPLTEIALHGLRYETDQTEYEDTEFWRTAVKK